MKGTGSTRIRWALVVIGALGCSAKVSKELRPTPSSLSASNGLGENGLWTNGLWTNGLWTNGLWTNGLWTNGLWTNGLWTNGLWTNGLWTNGLWANQTWAPGQSGDAALAGEALRENPYARMLLQYIYKCAMPPTTHDTSLDPNGGALTCSASAPCALGYECSPDNKCVIPLVGGIGVGINGDESSWADSGRCDESCQRWVSACLLARTNAYGVHVQISMRVPADAPAAIRQALAVTPAEQAEFTVREGAYYGNMFATTPVLSDGSPVAPAAGYSGPATGLVAATPVFRACAGPGSNIPDITRRFCSSQGDQEVIKVPGVCIPTAGQAGVCSGQDTDPSGAIHDCYTEAGGTGTPFKEVITIYLKKPVAVCGNGVCEAGEEATSGTACPSDCHEGNWVKDFDASYGLGGGVVDVDSSNTAFAAQEISALSPTDDSVVVAGSTANDVNLGNGTRFASDGLGVLAKLDPVDGHALWSLRFSPMPAPRPSPGWNLSGGITVDAVSGDIAVVGTTVDDYCIPFAIDGGCTPSFVSAIWVRRFSTNGEDLGGYSLPIGNAPIPKGPGSQVLVHPNDLTLTRAVAADSQGRIVLAAGYCGTMRFFGPDGHRTDLTSGCTPTVSGASSLGNGLFVAKLLPPATTSDPFGTVEWVQRLATGDEVGNGFDLAGYGGLSMAVDPASTDFLLLTGGAGGRLTKLRGADGAVLWSRVSDANIAYSVATFDGNGDVYVSGHFANGADFQCGSGSTVMPPVTSVDGLPPFVQKLDGSNNCKWVQYARTVCPWAPPGSAPQPCGSAMTDSTETRRLVEGVSLGFDTTGNVVLGSFGNPVVGGGIDFGVGTFPTYSANNIYLSTYDPTNGKLIWANQIPTNVKSFLLGMGLGQNGRIVVSGNYSGSMLVDGRLLVTAIPERDDYINAFLGSFVPPSRSDVTPPEIGVIPATAAGEPAVDTVPKTIYVQATGKGTEVRFVLPTALDGGRAGTTVACSPAPKTKFPIGTTPVTCTASDPLGNKSTASFTVTVADKMGPIFSPVPNITASAPTASGVVVTYTLPTATDQVDGDRAPSCLPASGSVFAVGSTTVTCAATDLSGNKSKVSFVVKVAGPAVGGACAATSDCATGYCVDGVCCASACGGGNVADCQACSVAAGGSANGSCTPISAARVCRPSVGICDAAESCDGSSLTCPADKAIAGCGPPVVTVPANMTVEATSAAGAVVIFSASAKDWHGTALANVSCNPTSGSTFAIGTKAVTCTASDADGQMGSASFTVTVKDGKGPVFGSYPDPVVAYATSTSGAKVTYTVPGATDAVDGKSGVTCTPTSGSQFAVNKTTVTCTATDNHGNSGKGTFTVWVQYQAPSDGSFFITPRADGSAVYKIGRPVPVRFKLTGASAGISNLVAKLQITKISNSVQGTVVDASDETVDDTDFTFKYRKLLNFYVYRWKTRDQTQGTYRLNAVLGDGVTHQVNVSVKP